MKLIYHSLFTIFFLLVVLVLEQNIAFADEAIFITKSHAMDGIKFDGKWSFLNEWKASSLYSINEQNQNIQLRTAHQGNFIYIFVDVLIDKSIDLGLDKTTICFDSSNDKNMIPNSDDYCFISTLGRNNGLILQGGSPIKITNYLKNVKNNYGFVAISSPSDQNDRYSQIPHGSYEFKIPIELIGRSNIYGFYLGVYDYSSNTKYTWPEGINEISKNNIPSPSLWGEIISPDKSLPEFKIIFFVLTAPIIFMLFFSKYYKKINFQAKLFYNNN